MIRLELLTETNAGLKKIGLSTLESDNFLVLRFGVTGASFVNEYMISFPSYGKNEKVHVTHIAVLPANTDTGLIVRLNKPMALKRKGDRVSFASGSLSWDMEVTSNGSYGRISDMLDELLENKDEAHKDLMLALDRYDRENAEVIDYLRKN